MTTSTKVTDIGKLTNDLQAEKEQLSLCPFSFLGGVFLGFSHVEGFNFVQDGISFYLGGKVGTNGVALLASNMQDKISGFYDIKVDRTDKLVEPVSASKSFDYGFAVAKGIQGASYLASKIL